jgi:hypothetical protein
MMDMPLFESVIAAGSGKQTFIKNVETFSGIKYNYSGEVNGLSRAMSFNFMLISSILSDEMHNANTLLELWGSGSKLSASTEQDYKIR